MRNGLRTSRKGAVGSQQLHPAPQYAGGNVTVWRWLMLIGLLVPSYWIGEGLAQLIEAVIEWNFFENRRVLYYFIGTTVGFGALFIYHFVASSRVLSLGALISSCHCACHKHSQLSTCLAKEFLLMPKLGYAGTRGAAGVPSTAVRGAEVLAVNLESVHPAAAAGAHVPDGIPSGAVGMHLQRAAQRQPHLAGGLQVDAAGGSAIYMRLYAYISTEISS